MAALTAALADKDTALLFWQGEAERAGQLAEVGGGWEL